MRPVHSEKVMAAELVALMGDDYEKGTLNLEEMIAYTGACMTLECPSRRNPLRTTLSQTVRRTVDAEFTKEVLAGYRNILILSVVLTALMIVSLWLLLIIAGIIGLIT